MKFNIKKDFIGIFEHIRAKYGKCNCAILDSVDGPAVDCGKSYIGVFPKYELIISNSKMNISTDNRCIYEIFIENFKNYMILKRGISI